MAHQPYEELISLSLDGLLTEPEERDLHEHLRTCAACTDLRARMQMLDAMFSNPPMVAPPMNFTASVMNRVESYQASRRWQPWLIGVLVMLSVVAALVIATPILVVTLDLWHAVLALPVIGTVLEFMMNGYWVLQGAASFGVDALFSWLTFVLNDPVTLAVVLTALVLASIWIGLLEVLKITRTVNAASQQA